jgi:hypothetical protein
VYFLASSIHDPIITFNIDYTKIIGLKKFLYRVSLFMNRETADKIENIVAKFTYRQHYYYLQPAHGQS